MLSFNRYKIFGLWLSSFLLFFMALPALADEPLTFLFEWGRTDGLLLSPNDVEGRSNNIYVVDDNDLVYKFNRNGELITSWGGSGSAEGKLDNPSGLAIDSVGIIFVADTNNHRVQKFNSVGGLSSDPIGSVGSGNGQFNGPKGLAINSSNQLYVVDSGNHRVQRFTASGSYREQWGTNGSGDGQFSNPSYIAIDSNDNFYVTDTGNNRVQKFNKNGTFLLAWGSFGIGNGRLNNPQGITIDSNDNIYVVDSSNSRIQKFDSNGNFLTKWGESGFGDNQFRNPQGIYAHNAREIYVADSGRHRMQKYGWPTLFFYEDTFSIREDLGDVELALRIEPRTQGVIEVNIATTDGTAIGGVDYTTTQKTLTINPDTLNYYFTIPVTNDDDMENDETFYVTITAITNAYLGLPLTATAIIDDEDTPMVNIKPTSLTMTEGGDSQSINISLNTFTVDPVTIGLFASNNECSIDTNSVELSLSNWATGVNVNVSPVDDTDFDNTQICTIQTTPAVSDNPDYSGLDPVDVTVTVEDNESGAVLLSSTVLTVTEPTGSETIRVTLNAEPLYPVSVNFPTSNNECTATPSTVFLNSLNWETGVEVVVTAVDDQIADGDQTCIIQTSPATSNDTTFDNYNPEDVTVHVIDSGEKPILQLSANRLEFSLEDGASAPLPTAKYVTLSNAGVGELEWTVRDSITWAIGSPFIIGSNQRVRVDILDEARKLPLGVHTGTVTVDAGDAGNSPQDIDVVLEIVSAATPRLEVAPTELNFKATVNGNNPTAQAIQISSSSTDNALNWTATENIPWLTLDSEAGTTPASPNVSVNITGLTANNYQGTITINADGATGTPQTVRVNLVVEEATPEPVLNVEPDGLTYQTTLGAGNPTAQTINISNSGTGTLNWTATEDIPWLTLNSNAGTAPATIQAQVDIAGLTVDTYQGRITIGSNDVENSPQTVTVTLVVSEDGPMTGVNLTPSILNFTAFSGLDNPASQALRIDHHEVSPFSWIAQTDTNWLSLNKTVGETTPATVTVSVDINGLDVGDYDGTITIFAPTAPNSPQKAQVRLVIEEYIPPPDLSIRKSVSKEKLADPQILEYTIIVANQGAGKAEGVDIVDTLPPAGVYVNGSATNGGMYDENNHTVTWSNLTFEPDSRVTHTLFFSPTVSGEVTLVNTATIWYEGSAQNQDTAQTEIGIDQTSARVNTDQETMLPIGKSGNTIRFKPQPNSFEATAIVLDVPLHPTTPEYVLNPLAEDNSLVENVGLMAQYFQLDAETLTGAIKSNFVASTVEITVKKDGTPNDDILFGLYGADVIDGKAGDDVIYGGQGNDILQGGDGNDTILGEAGDDILIGNNHDDQLYGGDGDDTLFGEAGNDTLFGDKGDDTLFGGSGNNALNGGEGADIYALATGEGVNTILIFIDGEDKLGLPPELSVADLSITQDDSDTIISVGNDTLAKLLGVTASQITSNDFKTGVSASSFVAHSNQITAQQTYMFTDLYLFYWDDSLQKWIDAAQTCTEPEDYRYTSSTIAVPICKTGEFALLRITATAINELTEKYFLPQLIKQ